MDTVLIFLYSGWRISELLALTPEDIDLQAGTMKGGTKTAAGKNRIVPIHHRIRPFIEARLTEGGPRLISYQGKPVSVSTYRLFWQDIMKRLGWTMFPMNAAIPLKAALTVLAGIAVVLISLWVMFLKMLGIEHTIIKQ